MTVCDSKMGHLFGRKKTARLPTLELTIDASLCDRIKKRALKDAITESVALLHSLERGMSDFGLHLMGEYKEDWAIIEQLSKECQRDNAILKAIENQNECFHAILEEHKKKQREAKDA